MPLPPEQSAVVLIVYMPNTNCTLVEIRNEATLREPVERRHGSRLEAQHKNGETRVQSRW